MREQDFYSVELPERKTTTVFGDKACYMPDGSIVGFNSRWAEKFAIYYKIYSGEWNCYYDEYKTIEDAIDDYNAILDGKVKTCFTVTYPVIAEIFDVNDSITDTKPKTLHEYKEKSLSIAFNSVFFSDEEQRIEITKELADYLVSIAKNKVYCKDCILVSDFPGYNSEFTALTRYYGKYYYVGYLFHREGVAFRNPGYVDPKTDSVRKDFNGPTTVKKNKVQRQEWNSRNILYTSLDSMQDKIVNGNRRIKELEKELEISAKKLEKSTIDLNTYNEMVKQVQSMEKKNILINDVVSGLNRSNSELKKENLQLRRELYASEEYKVKSIDRLTKESALNHINTAIKLLQLEEEKNQCHI